MTTIVMKGGSIACDGRYLFDKDIIADDEYSKLKMFGEDNWFFLAGSVCFFDMFIECCMEDIPIPEKHKGCRVEAIWVNKEGIWYIEPDPTKGVITKDNIGFLMDKGFSIGSGSYHAFTAMDMGADAVKAVKMAAKRDTNTGGTIYSWTIINDSGYYCQEEFVKNRA